MIKKENVSIDEMKNIFKRIIDFKKWEIGDGFDGEICDNVAYILYDEMDELPIMDCMISIKNIVEYINKQPTVDPVKHGHWLYQGKNIWYKCSKCGHQAVGKLPYCGNCGAAMCEATE